jgi:hypothetical protein
MDLLIIRTGVSEETDLSDAEVEMLREDVAATAEAPRGHGLWARVQNVLYNNEWEVR